MNDIIRLRLEEACKAHARGWLLTPLRGKKPYLKGWQAAPAPALATVEGWATKGNLGLRTGAVSGVNVLDDDTADGSGLKALNLPPTPTMITGSGKRHAYFKAPTGGLRNSVKKLSGVDVRADGGQVVYAYSIHPDTGQPYRWQDGLSPDDLPLAALPSELADQLRDRVSGIIAPKRPPIVSRWIGQGRFAPYATMALKKAIERIATSSAGTRNATLNREAFGIARIVAAGALVSEDAVAALSGAAHGTGLFESEIKSTIRSAFRAGMKRPFDLVLLEAKRRFSMARSKRAR